VFGGEEWQVQAVVVEREEKRSREYDTVSERYEWETEFWTVFETETGELRRMDNRELFYNVSEGDQVILTIFKGRFGENIIDVDWANPEDHGGSEG
jgi:hypothetical protein